MERHIPRIGEFYQHFKGKLYQITAVALDADSLEPQVVYQALYGTYQTYVRPLSEFMSEVDGEKYPNASQEFRFEQVVFQDTENGRALVPVHTTISPLADTGVDGERYQSIENQRKEIEGHRIQPLVNHVVGALEDHRGEADRNSVRYVGENGESFRGRPLTEAEAAEGVDPRLLAFLDADTYAKKLEIYRHMKDDITDKMLDDISIVLDLPPSKGELEDRYFDILKSLETQVRFER